MLRPSRRIRVVSDIKISIYHTMFDSQAYELN